MGCPEVWVPAVSFLKKMLQQTLLKYTHIEKVADLTGVVSEMMKESGGFGTRWMIDLINNIVK